MKTKIEQLIEKFPKHFSVKIKKDKELAPWVEDNCIAQDTASYSERVYSAINNCNGVCHRGNKMSYSNINDGYMFCGHASACQCNHEAMSKLVSLTKNLKTDEENDAINKKREQTMVEKYGVAFNTQRDEVKEIISKPKLSDEVFMKLNDREWLNEEYNEKKRSLVDIGKELNIYYGTVGEYCRKFDFPIRQRASYSLHEQELSEWLISIGVNNEVGNWAALGSHEIDVYIPEKKFGIEINGLYWHSYNPNSSNGMKSENPTKHYDKFKLAEEKGIFLFQLTDKEWIDKKDIIKSMISAKLGINETVYARNCEVRKVGKQESSEFVERYHVQGNIVSKEAYGLYSDDELVMIVTIGASRFEKQYDLEIMRVCSKSGITVVGGLSKLVKHIRSEHCGKTMVSYCDLDKGNGNAYIAAGFRYMKNTKPGYFWTDGDEVISRYKCQRKQLEKWLSTYDTTLSEAENLFNAKFRRYHTSGNRVFVLE